MADMGRVVEIQKEYAIVLIKAHSACSACKACSRGENGEMRSKALNLCEAAVGDFVEISLEGGVLTKAVLIAYGLPLLAMVFGFVVGYLLAGELFGFALGLACIFLAYFLIKMLDKSNKTKKLMPLAIRKISADMLPDLDFFENLE